MPEPREARSIIENAEQAAAAGNYASAEDLLREAAALQEQTLGPNHPDLANTLNNLGVVCEMTDNPIDAEHYFRRAYTIATATLAPDHPFVATSQQEPSRFLRGPRTAGGVAAVTTGVAAWLEAPAPCSATARVVAVSEEAGRDADPSEEIPAPARTWRVERGCPADRDSHDGPPLGQSGRGDQVASGDRDRSSAPRLRPRGQRLRRPSRSRDRNTTAKPTQPTRSEADAIGARPSTPASPAAMPTVATAQLCTALRAWRCEAADSQVPPGPMFFYTQVKSATATTIEHRWYQGDRLRRAVQLRIEANPGAGYRTYSRNTISSERAGDWRVELRSADGTVLHEERFTVR